MTRRRRTSVRPGHSTTGSASDWSHATYPVRPAGSGELVRAEQAPGVGPHEQRGVGPAAHEGLVVPAALEHHVDQRQRQRRIGAGPDLQPVLGLAGEPGAARVDHDEAGAAVERVDGRGGVHEPRDRRVVAPEEDAAGALEVGHEGTGDRCAEGVHRRQEAAPAAQLHRAGEVRAAEGPAQPRDPVHRVAQRRGRRGRRPEHHGLRAALVGDLPEPGGDGVERLVPADLLPTGIAALPWDCVRRSGWSSRSGCSRTWGADLPFTQTARPGGVSRIRSDGDEPTVDDGGGRAAARHTHRAEVATARRSNWARRPPTRSTGARSSATFYFRPECCPASACDTARGGPTADCGCRCDVGAPPSGMRGVPAASQARCSPPGMRR